MAKLLIIDTFGLIFRAYHAFPMLTTADGKGTNAIFGFIIMLLQTLEKINPDYIVCSLESETPTFRHELAHDYKANRKEMDTELRDQIGDIVDIIHTLGIKVLQKNGFEADDVIGSFATQHQKVFDEIRIVTGDRDLLQLISENIHILMPGKTFSDFVEFDRQRFEEKYNIKLEDFVLYKSIIGDSSDNIKGIPGVGPKGAEKIVSQFHSIDSILANLDQLPPRVVESITEYQDLWRNYYKLSKIDTDIDVEVKPEETKVSKMQVHKLRNIVEKYEFKSMQKRIAKFIDTFEKRYGGFGLFDETFGNNSPKYELEYSLVESVIFPSFESDEPIQSKEAYILNIAGGYRLGNGETFVDVSRDDLYNFIITNSIRSFVGFDLKPFIKELMAAGIEHIENFKFFDLQLAWYLIQSNMECESLNDLSQSLSESSYPKVVEKTKNRLQTEKLDELFNIERDLQKVLGHMEFVGISCDKSYLQELAKEYQQKIEKIKEEIFHFVGFEFNPASTKDLGHVLFEVLKLPVQKKNKTGFSTDDNTLSKLEGMSDIIPLIKSFRMYSKALSTYVVGLQNFIGEDGKIHTTYNQAQVATGRLSSINPNLQNLPTNEAIGTPIKKAFKPEDKNKVFISFDYSQIDLRVLAFESKDTALLEAFKNDEDIHTTTGRLIFEKEEITKAERNFAKTINFGIVYGMEPYGLSQALKIDQKAAKAFIEKYFEKFPGVKIYFERITRQLDEMGYVNSFLGRKRFFPNWSKVSGFQKRILFREAINMPIQGGSSELIKIAMNNVFEYLRKSEIKAHLLLQIHDELVFEVDKSENLGELSSQVQSIMANAYDIGVPIKTSMKKGSDLTFVG